MENYVEKEKAVNKLLKLIESIDPKTQQYSIKKKTIIRNVSSLKKYVVDLNNLEVVKRFATFNKKVSTLFAKYEKNKEHEEDKEGGNEEVENLEDEEEVGNIEDEEELEDIEEEEDEEKEGTEEEEEEDSVQESEEDSEEEKPGKMAHKIDLGVAIRVVDKYDGNAATLQSWMDSVDVLRTDDPEVPEINFLIFLKSRLVGAARGALDGVGTIAAAKTALKEKFAIQLTPIAVEAELRTLKQKSNKSITEFGSEVEKLATKLAAAWVSKGAPFTTEVSAKPVVEPIAIQTFINGLKDQSAAYLVKSRNPKTLTAAISDALEVQPQSSSEHTFWAQGSSRSPNFAHNYQNNRNQGHRGGRGYNNNSNRGYRGNSHNQRSNNQGYNNNNNHDYNSNNRGYYHNNNRYNRRNYNNNPNNNNPNNNYNNNNGNNANRNNNRNNNPNNNNNYQRRNANVAEEPQEQQPREEVNIGEFFRE